MTAEYEAALEAVRAASRAYNVAVHAYRAGDMADADYLAARATLKAAEAAFDAAFDINVKVSA